MSTDSKVALHPRYAPLTIINSLPNNKEID